MGSAGTVARVAVVALGVAGVFAIFEACGTDAVGVQQCRDIENARCQRAAACKIDLSQPLHEGSDVDSCIRFYNDQCLHGLVSGASPGSSQVSACIAAINGNCDYVANPTDSLECTFLIPGPDASVTDADAGEASTDDASDDGG